jgi:hypothetical protein
MVICTTLAVAFGVLSYQRAVATLQTQRKQEASRVMQAMTALGARYRNGQRGRATMDQADVTPDRSHQMIAWGITGLTMALLIYLLIVALFGLFRWQALSGGHAIAFLAVGCLALSLGLPAYHHAVLIYYRTRRAGRQQRSWFEAFPGETRCRTCALPLCPFS